MNIDWSKIPNNPGVYLWKDKYGEIIYIGKAKNIKNRMKSYFNSNQAPKTRLLVKYISDFDYQVSNNEIDALLLEQTLINEHQPKFNIKVKSSRTYPFIELKNSNAVSLKISKNDKETKNSKKFGPFPDGFGARKIIKLLSTVFPLDGCKNPQKGKPCLNYQMNRCMGECVGLNTMNQVKYTYDKINDFFKGDTKFVLGELEEKLSYYDKNLLFEESKLINEYIELVNKIESETIHAFNDSKDRDIIGFFEKDGVISISIQYIRNGIIGVVKNTLAKLFNPDIEDAIETFLKDHYSNEKIPDEIIMPFEPKWDLGLNVTIPKTGNKKELLDLTMEQAKSKHLYDVEEYIRKNNAYEESINFLKENIIDKEIKTIEMVDISSTMGSEQVGAIVRFKEGSKSKAHYRKYNINSINQMDDYKSMLEVITRHFKRILTEEREMPDVFIVDGKHQLKKAIEVMQELKIDNVTLMALKKNSKHKTESIINDKFEEIKLEEGTIIYNFLARIQEEVHRFVITFHRDKRSKAIMESALDKFEFLNEEDKNNLYKEFNTYRKIMIAPESKLNKVLSKSKVDKLIKAKEK